MPCDEKLQARIRSPKSKVIAHCARELTAALFPVQMCRTLFEMLTILRIKNLALVADLTLELQPGYNVITGETGAGKSILIGALNLELGERADRTLLRSGSDTCAIEAVFDIRRLKAPLKPFL